MAQQNIHDVQYQTARNLSHTLLLDSDYNNAIQAAAKLLVDSGMSDYEYIDFITNTEYHTTWLFIPPGGLARKVRVGNARKPNCKIEFQFPPKQTY